jgi:hypothetical protein
MTLRSIPNLALARQAARRIITDLGISDPAEIDVDAIAMTRDLVVQEDSVTGAEAWLIPGGRRGFVRLRSDIPEIGRKRFATAHELGHWELHRGLSQLSYCTDGDIHGYKGSPSEIEASAFAGELLMPTSLFGPRCRAKPSLALVKSLAETFATTLTATAVRFVEESRETCIAVFSKNGEIAWSRRKDGSDSPWIALGQHLHVDSIAYDVSKGDVPSSGMKPVPSEAWFPTVRRGTRLEVYEESIQLGHYPSILTLLHVIQDEEEPDEDE